MYSFAYQARDAAGKMLSGVQEALNEDNAINTLIKDNSSYDVTSKRAKPLNGDATIRNIQSALTGVTNRSLT